MRKNAFTLIELLVVIVIIGLLSSIATASYLKSQMHSRDSARRSNINSIAIAVETYYAQNHSFPGAAISTINPTSPALASEAQCESITPTKDVENSSVPNKYSPYYYYSPQSSCNTSASDTRYSPSGTWIPGLGQYLSPPPIETRFQTCKGDPSLSSSSPFVDYMDSSGGDYLSLNGNCQNQARNLSRSYVYRNLGSGYMVYARMESTALSDTYPDFCPTFAGIYGVSSGYPAGCGQEKVYLSNNDSTTTNNLPWVPYNINSISDYPYQMYVRPYIIRK